MTARAHDVTERAGALALLTVSVVIALWSRGRIADVEVTAKQREQQLEQIAEWQRTGVDASARSRLDSRSFAVVFPENDLVVDRGAGVDYLRLQAKSAAGSAR